MTEEWRPVVGFEGLYEVSNLGQVRSLDRYVDKTDRWGNHGRMFCRGRVLANGPHSGGYICIHLYKEGKRRATVLHIIIAEAFHGPRPSPLHEVLHGDGVRSNCAAGNLRWGTHVENEADKDVHGTRLIGEKSPSAKLTEDDVREIRRLVGVPQQDLADRFNCTFSNISAIQLRKSWRHV